MASNEETKDKVESYVEKVRRYERETGKRWSDWHTPKGRAIVEDLLGQLNTGETG